MDHKDIVLTPKEQSQIFQVAKGFATACEENGINAEETEVMLVEVMRATAQELIEDRKKKEKK